MKPEQIKEYTDACQSIMEGCLAGTNEITALASLQKIMAYADILQQERNAYRSIGSEGWIEVEDAPLFTKDENGNWTCTDAGDKEFIAAVPYGDSRKPDTTYWWIRHCVIQDEIGLCVVGDDDNDPAGYTMEDITHYQPLPAAPVT